MQQSASSSAQRHMVLAMLFIAYVFNFLDRQLISILAIPIKKELALTDAQIGLMGGMAFALFYAVLGVPAGWLADRLGRARVIGWSLTLWSLFTAACALAQGFWSLLVARMMVGVGEAGGVAPSYAVITTQFAPESRARALAFYNLAIPVGSALAMVLGGALAALWGWRAAFLCMGVAGLLFAPLFFWGLRSVPKPVVAASSLDVRALLRLLAHKPAFWLLSVGAGLGSLIGYGMMFWLPSLFVRHYALSLSEAGAHMALLFFMGGVVGIMAGGWLADFAGRTWRASYALIPCAAYALCVPAYYVALRADTAGQALLFLLVPQALSLMWMAPVAMAVQNLVPAAARSTASALFLLINNLIGLGLGTWVLGMISDHYGGASAAGLLPALQAGLVFYLCAALVMLWAARHIARDWAADAPA